MSEALYERYKDALRRGHVAALRGRHDAALVAYGEAARLAPDRALPMVGIGTVLTRMGKSQEAVQAFDTALERAPSDEAALRGRAEALSAVGDRAGAADALDQLALVLDAAGRTAEALDAARRALESAESRSRRATIRSMTARLAATPVDPALAEALAAALGVLDRDAAMMRPGSPPGRGVDASDAGTPPDERPQPQPEPEPLSTPFHPGQAIAAVDDAAEGDDADATRELALVATAGHRAAGQAHAAIDVCYLALASNPADPGLHLALAELYLDQGWRTAGSDKLVLLARLAELEGDDATRRRVCELASTRLPDEARLTAICA